MEHQSAIDASEKHSRVIAKQQEIAYLQHLLDQVGGSEHYMRFNLATSRSLGVTQQSLEPWDVWCTARLTHKTYKP